jgi:hypothetical protein
MDKYSATFYGFWSAYSAACRLIDEMPFMAAEEIVELESVCNETLEKVMEIKAQILNAKENANAKLQTSDLQRGVLSQTEEGEKGVCPETDTDKETLSALFRSKELNGRNYPNLHGEGESYIV